MPSIAQLSVVPVVHATASGIPAQASPTAQLELVGSLERWHVALAAQTAAELRGRAQVLLLSDDRADRALSEVERDRAILWHDLSRRIGDATRGVEVRFTARDVELVRWYRLVQLHGLESSKTIRGQKAAAMDKLFNALYAALLPLERDRCDRELVP